MRKRLYQTLWFCIALLSVLVLVWFGFQTQIKTYTNSLEIRSFQKELNHQEARLERLLKKISRKNPENLSKYYAESNSDLFFLKYVNDTLVRWSSSHVPISTFSHKYTFYGSLIKLKNGWYLMKKIESGNTDFVGLLRIKSTYELENDILKNKFNACFNITEKAEIITLKNSNKNAVIQDKNRQKLFYLDFPSSGLFYEWASYFVLSFIYLILGCLIFILFQQKKNLYFISIPLILVRVGMLYYNFPNALINSTLFNPSIYASSWIFPSLGDYLINFLLLIVIVRAIKNELPTLQKTGAWIIQIVAMISIFFTSLFVFNLMTSLIEDSNVNLNLREISSFDTYHYLSYLALFLSIYFLLQVVSLFYDHLKLKFSFFILILFGAIIFQSYYKDGFEWILISLLLYFALLFIRQKVGFLFSVSKSSWISLAFVSSLAASGIIQKAQNAKEMSQMKYISETIKNNQDISLEISISENEPAIQDFFTKNIIDISPEDIDINSLTEDFRQNYFSKFGSEYNINLYVFYGLNYSNLIYLNETETRSKDYGYFASLLSKNNTNKITDQLYHLANNEGREDYVLSLSFTNPSNPFPYHVYVVFSSNSFNETIGFPNLLQETKSNYIDQTYYSYANYKNFNLIKKGGTFQYPTKNLLFSSTQEKFVKKDGFLHYITPTASGFVLVSKPSVKILDYITHFSYLFFYFFILLFFGEMIFNNRTWRLNYIGISGKIQFSMVVLLLMLIIITGVGTFFYLKSAFESRNTTLLQDKLRSVVIETEQKVGNKAILSKNEDEVFLKNTVDKFSNIFYTDINLYNLHGDLLTSSSSGFFNRGIISEKMNPLVYEKLKFRNLTEYIHTETLEGLQYLSAYVPIHNKKGATLAYLNLPYITNNEQFNNEWASFFTTLLNVYILLFGLFLIASFFIGNWLTKPLKIMQQLMADINIGQENKSLAYVGKDEVGDFIKVYNRKVNELNEKTAQLSQTQKELAWKEMAKQVAHEIKNPLTPMKLSIQHLSRALKIEDKDSVEKLKIFEKMMVQQIDALSKIAEEFSDFAKLPPPHKINQDILVLILQAMELYSSHEHVKISVHSNLEAVYFNFDKNQMLRVLNNLIKNAIQAIPEEKAGEIEISIEKTETEVLITIKDNGTGIPEEIKDRMFSPNFTTKSQGTGLGLAMVKKIMEQHNGTIDFDSEKGTGTTFYLRFEL